MLSSFATKSILQETYSNICLKSIDQIEDRILCTYFYWKILRIKNVCSVPRICINCDRQTNWAQRMTENAIWKNELWVKVNVSII